MRQFLLMAFLLVGSGCQCFHDRIHSRRGCVETESCQPVEKKVLTTPAPEKPKETLKAPEPAGDPALRAAMGQEVLLIPRTVFVPFVQASPNQPMRMTPNMTVMGPQGNPEPLTTPRKQGDEELKKANETCEKLLARIEQLEDCLKQRTAPPTLICPPALAPRQPLLPLFRRPLFNRCDPFLPTCDPQCEPAPVCEPVPGSVPAPAVEHLKSLPKGRSILNID